MQQAPHQQQNKENKEDSSSEQKASENANFAPLKEDSDERERKAAAQLKLRKLEEKMKERTKQEDDMKIEDLDHDHKNKEESDYSVRPLPRSRNDSEASDSSRRSGKEVPPRFQRKRSGQIELNSDESKNYPMFFIIDISINLLHKGPDIKLYFTKKAFQSVIVLLTIKLKANKVSLL